MVANQSASGGSARSNVPEQSVISAAMKTFNCGRKNTPLTPAQHYHRNENSSDEIALLSGGPNRGQYAQ
jgi:hypothetical protein